MAYMRAVESSVHHRFLRSIPEDIRLLFAYGSGVFKQTGHGDEKANMLDYILVVDNPVIWHAENLTKNRNHYSFLRFGGPKFIAEIQQGFGAGVYFNTLVKFEDRLVKYGVIGTEDLENDLKNWTTLYVSGRLHKPVLIVKDNTGVSLQHSMTKNLQSAVQTALLLLPDVFSDQELFLTIAALSYSGDFRMTFGEDKNKIRNVVLPHLDKFHDLYGPLLSTLPFLSGSANFQTFQQECSPSTKHSLLTELPTHVRDKVVRDKLCGNRNKDIVVILGDLAHSPDCSRFVAKACREVVSYSSWWQSIKGIFTAGVRKSIIYSSKKVLKMFKGGKNVPK